MNEILKLAEECGVLHISEPSALEAFYRAAFNQGIEAAAKHLDSVETKYAAKWEEMGESYYEGYRDCADVSAGQIRGLVK